MLLPVGLCWQSLHKIFQLNAVFRGQFSFERIRQSSPHSTHPTIALIVQIGSPSGQFAGWVHLHSISRANDPHHLSFRQNFTASHAGSLGHMFYTLGRFLSHLQITRRLFPIISSFIAAALVYLTANDCAQAFVKLQFNGFLLALLALLLVTGFLFCRTSVLEDFGLHLE